MRRAASGFERRQADLFYFDLMGYRPRRARALPTAPPPEPIGMDAEFWPENLAPDMTGLEFVLADSGPIKMSGTDVVFAKGTAVKVVTWDNAKPEVSVTLALSGSSAEVLKELLEVKPTAYSAKVTTAKAEYNIACPLYAADVPSYRRQVLQDKKDGKPPRYFNLNRHLILDAMLNRQDHLIGAWTGHYHAMIGEAKDWRFLAPSWVKSMMIQESTAGTAGRFLDEVTGIPWKTRFNVLQAIDSWGFQQFLVMNEIEPSLLKSEGMDKIMVHQAALSAEWDKLKAKASRTAAESARLTYLDELKFLFPATRNHPNWNTFFFRYPGVDLKPKPGGGASGAAPSGTGTTGTDGGTTSTTTSTPTPTPAATRTYYNVVSDFLNAGTPKRRYDYSFWIRTAVRWMYEKRIKGKGGWADMVRDYNGTGAGAELYRAIVLARAHASTGVAGIKDDIWEAAQCGPDVKTKSGVFQLCTFEHAANPCDARC